MKKSVLFVAPHPDDESLGCGGTIAKYRTCSRDEIKIFWLLVTEMKSEYGFSENQIKKRQKEIAEISALYNFDDVFSLGLQSSDLENVSKSQLIQQAAEIIDLVQATDIFLPFFGDAHSDHKIVFESFFSACKSFRRPSIKRILCYETLSETNFGIRHFGKEFVPNVYENIEKTFEKKLQALNIYKGEILEHPFPRSINAVRALAELRGSECKSKFAEAFFLIKEMRE